MNVDIIDVRNRLTTTLDKYEDGDSSAQEFASQVRRDLREFLNEPIGFIMTRDGKWDDPMERVIASAVQKRDAEWRGAVERVREERMRVTTNSSGPSDSGYVVQAGLKTLDAVLVAMEGR